MKPLLTDYTLAELEDLFEDLAENISKPGATNIVIDEALNPDFTITSISMPTKGGATMINQTSLRWTIDQLGVTANEGASLEFWIKHVGNSSGNKLVNQSITYTDSENNQAIFPTPSVMVDCGIVVMPEPCPEPGYTDEVIMASGSFTQGSTIELSCDGPLREPYTCYLQGGLNFAASRAGVLLAVQNAYFKN